jgi:hypothetical protein
VLQGVSHNPRYLKSVYAAEPVGTGDVLHRQLPGARPRKVTGNWPESSWLRHYLGRAPVPAITGPQAVVGKPSRSAGPLAARAPEAARQQCRSSTREQLRRATALVSYMRSAVSTGRSRGDMSTPQKHPLTRHYLRTTSDNRRYARRVRSGA